MNYRTIYTIKESEKATVELADVEGVIGPAVVKRLKGANPDIYRLLCCAQNSHIPKVFFCEEQGKTLLVVEEYVDGENLAEFLKQEQLNDTAKLGLALQLCEAVEFLHSMVPPVIHRDIKPSNIVINGKGVLKLIDFDASRQYKNLPNEEDTRLLGTRGYAAPEQFGYAQTDVRSDIYSMGIVFHEMKLSENKKTVEQWERIAEKCTSFDPKNRYQNVQELADEIRKLLNRKKIWRKKVAAFCTVAAVIFAFAVTVVSNFSGSRDQEQETEGVAAQLTEPPEPTATFTPVPTSAPTLMPTPTVAVTLSSTPTEAPTPVPTETPTLTPTPTATSTPVPTSTVTPHPTATLTPRLTVFEVSPTPIVLSTKFQYALNPLNEYAKEYHFYLSELETTELIFDNSNWYKPNMYMYQVSCYDYETGITWNIPLELVEDGNGYIRVSDALLSAMEPSRYHMWFYFKTSGNNYYSTGLPVDLVLHGEEEERTASGDVLAMGWLSCYLGYPRDVAVVINSDVADHFNGKLVHKQSNEVTVQVDASCYELACDGKVIVMKKEYLAEFKGGTRQEFTAWLQDGRQQSFQINIEDGLPDYITPEYLGLTSTPAPVKTNIASPTPTPDPNLSEVEYHYYFSFLKDLAISCENYEEYEIFDYATVCNTQTSEVVTIPAERLELENGYIMVSELFLLTLDPGVYRFTLYYRGIYGGTRTCETTVEIHSGDVLASERKLVRTEQTIYSECPGTISNMIRNGEKCKIKSVFLQKQNGETVSWDKLYNLEFDSWVVTIDGKTLLPYFEQGKLSLYIELDNGTVEKMEIELIQGNPPVSTWVPEMEGIRNNAVWYNLEFSEDSDLIFLHNMEKLELTEVMCYCHATAEMMEIPLDMVETGMGYICVSREYMKNLETLAYKFIFNDSYGINMSWWVLVAQNSNMKSNELMGNHFYSLIWEYASYMPGVGDVLLQEYQGKITGVCLKQEDGIVEPIQPELYNITCDDRCILVKKEFFMQYSIGEKVTLIFTFDDGSSQECEISIVGA